MLISSCFGLGFRPSILLLFDSGSGLDILLLLAVVPAWTFCYFWQWFRLEHFATFGNGSGLGILLLLAVVPAWAFCYFWQRFRVGHLLLLTVVPAWAFCYFWQRFRLGYLIQLVGLEHVLCSVGLWGLARLHTTLVSLLSDYYNNVKTVG